MNSRIKRLSFLAVCSLTLVGVVAAFSASYRIDHYNAGTYSLTLDANNGKITSTSYGSGTTTANTSNGNPIGIAYTACIAKANYFAQLQASNGNLYSTTPITGLTSIIANFTLSGADGALKLFSSDTTTFGTDYVTLTDGSSTAVTSKYFMLQAGSRAVYLESVVLTYTCVAGASSSSGVTSSTTSSTPTSTTSSTTSTSSGSLVSASIIPVSNNKSDSTALPGTTGAYALTNITLSSVAHTSVYYGGTTSSTYYKVGAGSTQGIITFNFSSSVTIKSMVVTLKQYGTDVNTIAVVGGASATSGTISASTTSFDLTSSFSTNSVGTTSLVVKGSVASKARFYFGGVAFTYASSGTSSSASSSVPTSISSTVTSTSGSSASTSSSSSAGYYKPTGDMTTPTFNYKKLNNTQDCDVLPTTGNLKVLVLPIELTDYPFSSQTLSDLGNAFNGVGSADTGYWESLASFYKKSSFGKLNLTYTIGAKFSSGYTAQSLYNKNSSDHSQGSSDILRLAVANYKSVTSSTCTSFDSDTNGLIDAVIMVYSCPDVQSSSAISNIDSGGDLFWAYCFWDYNNYANSSTTSPVACNYFWMSYDFLYEEAASPKVDAHTLIHESGHLMGLDDYYSYDTLTTASSVTPAPAGGIDMMDLNICDHDVFSKMALNWTKPYVVTGSCSITINPSEEGGDCILVPTSSGWNGTAFDEYLLMELYTPTNLNQLDAETKYSTRVQGYTTSGIKLYHVDSRVTKLTSSTAGTYVTTPPTSFTAAGSNGYPIYTVAATNSRGRDSSPATGNSFDLLRLIEAGKTNTFNTNNGTAGVYGTNATLFKTGDTFTLGTYGNNFFPKKTTFNNGATLGFNISFTSVSSTSATITFTAA